MLLGEEVKRLLFGPKLTSSLQINFFLDVKKCFSLLAQTYIIFSIYHTEVRELKQNPK
jgi:hypothetical protein